MAKKVRPSLLVIGGTGFIGYHLLLKSKKKGWRVTSVSLNKPKKYRFVSGVNYIRADIGNFLEVKKKINKSYDYVVNLGGYGNHSNYNKGGEKILKSHFFGLVNLVKIIPKIKLKKFIQIGSSAEYGNSLSPQKESMSGLPSSPYAMAKLACTNFSQMLYKTEGYPISILRFFLVYGPRQDSNRILPQVIKGCIGNKKFNTSKGNQMRDFCYIDDVIEAIFLTLRSNKIDGEIFNIGSGKAKKIKEVITYICKEINGGKPQYGKIKYRKNENMKLYPNIKKAESKLKWKPRISFKKGMRLTIESYK